jgi:hypothetical protein
MTTAANNSAVIGFPAVGNWFIPDNVQRLPLGTVMSVIDPFWGGQELIYVSFPASTAVVAGTPLVWDNAFSATAIPNTANLGQPLGFALNAVPSVAAVQYGWALVSGRIPAYSNASVAANAQIGIAAAGKLGANSAGKEILGAKVQAAATTTVAKANTVTQSGSPIIKATNTDGWFVGMAVSGTGIAASSVVNAIDPDNRTVTLNNNATATGAVTVTGTYNDGANFWNVLYVDRPSAQGAIT